MSLKFIEIVHACTYTYFFCSFYSISFVQNFLIVLKYFVKIIGFSDINVIPCVNFVIY